MIVTKHLLLVPWNGNLADVNKHVQWLNDKDVVRYSEQRHRTHNVRSQLDYLESIQAPSLFLQITCTGKLIGSITAFIDKHNHIADMGILIGDKSVWGMGYGTEAWTALMQHLLNNGIRKVEAGCVQLNQGMLHVFRKSGMHYEGCRENHFLVDGDPWAMEYWGRYND